jgi:hypothetical protein
MRSFTPLAATVGATVIGILLSEVHEGPWSDLKPVTGAEWMTHDGNAIDGGSDLLREVDVDVLVELVVNDLPDRLGGALEVDVGARGRTERGHAGQERENLLVLGGASRELALPRDADEQPRCPALRRIMRGGHVETHG